MKKPAFSIAFLLLFGIVGVLPSRAQNFLLDGAVVGRLAYESPFAWGPNLGLSYMEKQENWLFTLRWSRIKGGASYPTFGYRLNDYAQRFGFSVVRSIYKGKKLNLGLGLAVDYLTAKRNASGDPLSWGRSYRATGFGIGLVGRAFYGLGEKTSLGIIVEPGYWSYTNFTLDHLLLVPLGRPLESTPSVMLSIGFAFVIGA